MFLRQFSQFILGLAFITSSGFVSSETSFDYEFITESITTYYGEGISINGCHGCGTEVIIPEKIGDENVIEIGFQAFKDSNVQSVSFPSSLKRIWEEAFANNNITTLNLLYGNVIIKETAFSNNPINHVYYCADMWGAVPGEDIIWQPYNNCPTIFSWREFIPGQSDGGIAVTGCQNDCQSELVIPEYIDGYQVVSIYASAFNDEGISSVSFPDSLMHIQYNAFIGNQLTSVSFPEGLASIDSRAFADNMLTSVSVPNSVSNLSRDAFSGNIGVISGEWRYIERLGDAMLLGCADNCPIDMIIPDYIDGFHVQSIDDEAFSEEGLNSIRFPDGIVHLGYNAFLGNPLTSVTYCSSDNSDWDFGGVEGITPQLDESCGIPNEANETISYAALDIDQNGSFDALTDGLILLRYAFGLTGDNLIDGVIDSNANRTNAADIEAHIQSLVP